MNNGMTLALPSVAAHGWLKTVISSTLHFLVDGLCVCCLFLLAGSASLFSFFGAILLYNVLAFLTQPFTGMLADRIVKREALLACSAALLASGVAFASFVAPKLSSITAYSVAVLLGMGNSLFHVWGGKEVALSTKNDVCALGLFVSTGALGLAVGMLLHAWWLLYVFMLLIALLASIECRTEGVEYAGAPQDTTGATAHSTHYAQDSKLSRHWLSWLAVLLLMSIVAARSFLGETFTASVGKGGMTVLLIGALAMTGKALGGWLARGIGLATVFAVAVAGAVVCLLLKDSTEWLWIAGLLLVNGTMAVTLCWANHVMPGREGLVFGLLAAALMPGYLIVQTSSGSWPVLLPHLLSTLLPTVVLELAVLWMLRERRADVLWSSVVVNILTNIPLNLYVTYVSDSITTIVIAEALVVVVETLWYVYFVRSLRTAFAYSILCNGISLFTGLLLQMLIILTKTV